jgi:hypothetical protein
MKIKFMFPYDCKNTKSLSHYDDTAVTQAATPCPDLCLLPQVRWAVRVYVIPVNLLLSSEFNNTISLSRARFAVRSFQSFTNFSQVKCLSMSDRMQDNLRCGGRNNRQMDERCEFCALKVQFIRLLDHIIKLKIT